MGLVLVMPPLYSIVCVGDVSMVDVTTTQRRLRLRLGHDWTLIVPLVLALDGSVEFVPSPILSLIGLNHNRL